MWWSVPEEAFRDNPANWDLRTFAVATTGPPGYSADLFYVGTFQVDGYVGHVVSRELIPRTEQEAIYDKH